MSKYFLLFCLVISPILLTINSFAQDQMALDAVDGRNARSLSDTQWQATLESIKSDTSDLLEANTELNSEYEFLKQKMADLQNSFAKVKEENAKLEADNQKLEKSRTQQRQAFDEVQQQMLELQNESGDLNVKNKPLREQLSELEEENAQLQKRLQELQGQRRELLLDLKLQEASRSEMEVIDDEETQKLNSQLSAYQAEEKDLNEELTKSQEEMKAILDDLEKFNQENREFEDQLADLRSQKEGQFKINEQLKRENERLAKSQGPADLVKQKNALESKIDSLTKELDSIRKSVQDSSAILEKRRSLMDEVMKVDAENQELRNQVVDLLQKIDGLKSSPEASTSPSESSLE